MRSVLRKRFKRELVHEFGKYLVIFLFLAGTIGFVSGFLVTSDSILKTYYDGFEKYQIEDGCFELMNKASDSFLKTLEEKKLSVYEKFFLREETDEFDSRIHIYMDRTEGDLVCLMKGVMPKAANEIALDRMYATYNKLSIGDSVSIGGKKLVITGYVALPEYQALYEKSSDMMFDASRFGVGILSEEGFASYGEGRLHYDYAFRYEERPDGTEEEKKRAEELISMFLSACTASGNPLVEFLPAYLNNAIQLPGDDMGKDSVFVEFFLYIVIATLAFIFAITISNTITKESMVIGTLRASGYTKLELIVHYMTLPMLVVLIAGICGNILGYTVFRDFATDMYYDSYSLATYTTVINTKVFLRTTMIPFGIMFVINLLILLQKLSLSPLRFLRRDIGLQKKKGVLRLSDKISILSRYRLRVFFRNIPHYVTLLIGIFFANALILFGVAMPSLMDHFEVSVTDRLLCSYQYILKTPLETTDSAAEKYSVTTLKTLSKDVNEEVSVFGVKSNSSYLTEFSGETLLISSAYASKYKLEKGDEITLKEPYGEKQYKFTVGGVIEYPGAISVFLPINTYRSVFSTGENYFNGYFSDKELTDLPEQAVFMTLTAEDMTKTARQFKKSLGGMMILMYGFGVVMFLLMCYLLTRLIIEKDSQAISMTKILGYSNGEIGKVYILTTSLVVILCLIGTIPLVDIVLKLLVEILLKTYPGWIPYFIPFIDYVKIILLGVGTYFVILMLQLLKIKKIKKSEALKTAE